MSASIVVFLKGFNIGNYQPIVNEFSSLLESLKATMKNLEIEDLNHPLENNLNHIIPSQQPPSPVKFQRNKMYATLILEESQENQQLQALPIQQSSPYIGFQLSGEDLTPVITAMKNHAMQLFFCGSRQKIQGNLFHFDEPIILGIFSSSFSVKAVKQLGNNDDNQVVEKSKEQTFADSKSAFNALRKLLANQDPHDHLQDQIQGESSEIIFQNTPFHTDLLLGKESDKDEIIHSQTDISNNKDNNNNKNNNEDYGDLNCNPFSDLFVKSNNNEESTQSQLRQQFQYEQHTPSESIQEQSTKIEQSDVFYEFNSENQNINSNSNNHACNNQGEEQQSLRQSIRRADSVYLAPPLRKKIKPNRDSSEFITKKIYDYEDNEDEYQSIAKGKDNNNDSSNNLLLIGVVINFIVMMILYFK